MKRLRWWRHLNHGTDSRGGSMTTAVVFDVIGMLFDVSPLREGFRAAGAPETALRTAHTPNEAAATIVGGA
jgi:hypothetical protein